MDLGPVLLITINTKQFGHLKNCLWTTIHKQFFRLLNWSVLIVLFYTYTTTSSVCLELAWLDIFSWQDLFSCARINSTMVAVHITNQEVEICNMIYDICTRGGWEAYVTCVSSIPDMHNAFLNKVVRGAEWPQCAAASQGDVAHWTETENITSFIFFGKFFFLQIL
jgi:hypothetical protein